MFSKSFVQKLVFVVIKYSRSEPRHHFYEPHYPYTPANPAYLVRNEEGLWEAKWDSPVPEGALFAKDAEKRGVPQEEFQSIAYLTWNVMSSTQITRKFAAAELLGLRKWISARLETGLSPETEAIIAPFYSEPEDAWPASWRCFKESMGELAEESEKTRKILGLSCGMSGAELDKRYAVAKAWRIRMGYEAE